MVITVEEGSIGGFGAFVMQFLAEEGLIDGGLKVRAMVLPDTFIDHDKPEKMYAQAGLDAKGIVAKVQEVLGMSAASAPVPAVVRARRSTTTKAAG